MTCIDIPIEVEEEVAPTTPSTSILLRNVVVAVAELLLRRRERTFRLVVLQVAIVPSGHVEDWTLERE